MLGIRLLGDLEELHKNILPQFLSKSESSVFQGSLFCWQMCLSLLPAVYGELENIQGQEFFSYQAHWKPTDVIRLGGLMCFISQWHHDRWECSAKSEFPNFNVSTDKSHVLNVI